MKRSLQNRVAVSQKNDASCIGNKRGMARRAKRNSNKRLRQGLQQDLESLLEDSDALASDMRNLESDWKQ